MQMALSSLEAGMLDVIQEGFPPAADPYGILAERLACTRELAQATVLQLRRCGIIRRIGGSFAAPRLGYVSTLVAARVAGEQVDAVAGKLNAYREVTHNYLRDGAYNLWFTIIAEDAARLETLLAAARTCAGVLALQTLPALHRYKIRVNFNFSAPRGAEYCHRAGRENHASSPPFACDATDRRLIARLCGDIDDSLAPFAALAREIDLREAALFERMRRYHAAGAMRRFGAVLRHQLAGFPANVLSLWQVPPEQRAQVGEILAAHSATTHCYERPVCPDWPYSLYAMLHGHTPADCTAVAEELSQQAGIADYQLLFSLQEYKKTSMVYFAEQ